MIHPFSIVTTFYSYRQNKRIDSQQTPILSDHLIPAKSMTQQQLDLAVARATGEALSEIRSRGFSIADPSEVAFDPEPDDLPPQILDWDELEQIDALYASASMGIGDHKTAKAAYKKLMDEHEHTVFIHEFFISLLVESSIFNNLDLF